MIRISPKELNFAASLGAIRRRPSRSTGPANALRYHQLSYSGGSHLTFATTDFQISMVSKLPVEGNDDAWQCRVAFENFHAFAAEAAGGKLTLNASSPRCVRAEKLSPANIDILGREFLFAYPFFRISAPTPYPHLELVEVTQTAIVRRLPLRDALAFVAPAVGEMDTGTRLNSCTITATGEVIGCDRHVFLRAIADPTGYEVNLPSPDAGRLGAWLSLFNQDVSPQIEMSTGKDLQGRLCHQFRTTDHDHTFLVIAAPRPVPTEFVQAVHQAQVAISGTVAVTELREIARYFSHDECNPLLCRFRRGSHQWGLQLSTTGDAPQGGGELSLGDCQVTDEEAVVVSLFISPLHLRVAIDRYPPGRLRINYLPQVRIVSLTDNQPKSRLHTVSDQRCFVRVKVSSEPTGT